MRNRIQSLKVSLLTGGIDKHYASGLSKSLASSGIPVEVICNTEMGTCELQNSPNLKIVTLYTAPQGNQNKIGKLLAYILVYIRLIHYGATSSAGIFHILWNYKFTLFDRTLLLLYYKALGKQLVFTAHNINAGERDGSDSILNRLSLRFQYRLVDHIFVHTEKMKAQLIQGFGVAEKKITIIPFGTYDMVPQSPMTPAEAKRHLGLRNSDRAILFFGRIVPYKGIDLLVDAFERIALKDKRYRLVIAGQPMRESEEQWGQVQRVIEQSPMKEQVDRHTRFIGDDEIELYFKAADVLILPYTEIFQSGVLFMAYSFGLPVIATDVGSFGRDIIAGITGYVCRPKDPADLSRAIEVYFSSDLYRTLEERRAVIQKFVQASHSWEIVANQTGDVYGQLAR